MYRQIRTDNCSFMKESELPEHVQKLVAKLQEDELKERELKDFKKSICRVSSATDTCGREQIHLISYHFLTPVQHKHQYT